MIALVMLYAAIVGAVCAGGAWLAERAATAAGRAARWAWAAGVVLSVALPAAALWRAARAGPAREAVDVERVDLSQLYAGARAPRPVAAERAVWWRAIADGPRVVAAPAAWTALDRPLGALWGLLTAGLLARVAVAATRTRRVTRGWPVREVDGIPVRVSHDVGPAAVGGWRAEVVLPAWALHDARLSLVIAHECEHIRAHDPRLLAGATLVAALVPWSPAAWWQVRRLRAALEVDCDRRVLARHRASHADETVRTYGALLLDVAARPSAGVAALMLGGTPTLLQRRIDTMLSDAMLSNRSRVSVRAAVPALAAAAVLCAACEVPRPTGPAPATRIPLTSIAGADASVAPGAGQNTSVDAVRGVIAARFPELLVRARHHQQRVWVVQRADGTIERAANTDATSPQRIAFGRARLSVEDSGRTMRVNGTADDSGTGVFGSGDPLQLATIDPGRIASVEVLRIQPGRVAADSVSVVWVRLRAERAPAAPGGATALGASTDGGAGRIRVDVGSNGAPNGIQSGPLDAPLVYVDGREVAGMAALPNPAKIARVDVLKGEAAVREYGARAALGGVVRVTTKSDSAAR